MQGRTGRQRTASLDGGVPNTAELIDAVRGLLPVCRAWPILG